MDEQDEQRITDEKPLHHASRQQPYLAFYQWIYSFSHDMWDNDCISLSVLPIARVNSRPWQSVSMDFSLITLCQWLSLPSTRRH